MIGENESKSGKIRASRVDLENRCGQLGRERERGMGDNIKEREGEGEVTAADESEQEDESIWEE